MRIEPEIIGITKDLSQKYFGEDSEVRIFGSRIDDRKKGGDIDIYTESSLTEGLLDRIADFLAELKIKIGDRKVDLVVKKKGQETDSLIYRYAEKEGVKI
ncbi:MAG: hypothetical protein N2257_10270 [Thermodesulfovibrionales bacterium]|nr:hypothetical protein [Thermodesulfovibrionales bacterium]